MVLEGFLQVVRDLRIQSNWNILTHLIDTSFQVAQVVLTGEELPESVILHFVREIQLIVEGNCSEVIRKSHRKIFVRLSLNLEEKGGCWQ